MPEATDWKALSELQGQELRQLSSRDFLHRLNVKGDLTGACQTRVQKDNNGKKGPQREFDAAVEDVREDFRPRLEVTLSFS